VTEAERRKVSRKMGRATVTIPIGNRHCRPGTMGSVAKCRKPEFGGKPDTPPPYGGGVSSTLPGEKLWKRIKK